MGGTEECLFCRITEGAIPAKLVHEDDQVIAFHDINPQAPHHVLVCPRAHIATLNDVTPDQEALVGHAVSVATMLAERFGDAQDGFRVVINCQAGAGQSVFHLHVHLLGGRPFGWPPG